MIKLFALTLRSIGLKVLLLLTPVACREQRLLGTVDPGNKCTAVREISSLNCRCFVYIVSVFILLLDYTHPCRINSHPVQSRNAPYNKRRRKIKKKIHFAAVAVSAFSVSPATHAPFE